MKRSNGWLRTEQVAIAVVALLVAASPASAQVTPAAGYTPPDDTPSIKVGATIFADYTYQVEPEVKDADGNSVNFNAFNVSRAYINVTGNISHLLGFRITPDITRENPASAAPLNGSLTFRLKYGYAQLNLDDWMPQGLVGAARHPADALGGLRGSGVPIPLPGHDLRRSRRLPELLRRGRLVPHRVSPQLRGRARRASTTARRTSKPEANDQKAIQIRGTFRPLPQPPTLRGLRATAFYDADSYVRDGDRNDSSRRRPSSTNT